MIDHQVPGGFVTVMLMSVSGSSMSQKNNMGKVYGPFQALLLQLPRMLVLKKERTCVWNAEATGAAVAFIAVLLRGLTSA